MILRGKNLVAKGVEKTKSVGEGNWRRRSWAKGRAYSKNQKNVFQPPKQEERSEQRPSGLSKITSTWGDS